MLSRKRNGSSPRRRHGPSDRKTSGCAAPSCRDFSARDIQVTAGKIGMGPAPGKDWANALGPCIVTRDEFGDLRDQSIAVRVNNEERLRDRYRNMVFENPWAKEGPRALWSFPEMVEFLSRFQPIYAGEVWGSGTIP